MRGEFNRDAETNRQSAWVCGRGSGRLAPTGYSPEPLASRVAPLTWSKSLSFSGTFLSYRQKRVLGSLALMLAFKWVFSNVWMSMLFASECFFLFLEQSGLGMDEVGLVCIVTDIPCLSSLNVSFSQRVMQNWSNTLIFMWADLISQRWLYEIPFHMYFSQCDRHTSMEWRVYAPPTPATNLGEDFRWHHAVKRDGGDAVWPRGLGHKRIQLPLISLFWNSSPKIDQKRFFVSFSFLMSHIPV